MLTKIMLRLNESTFCAWTASEPLGVTLKGLPNGLSKEASTVGPSLKLANKLTGPETSGE